MLKYLIMMTCLVLSACGTDSSSPSTSFPTGPFDLESLNWTQTNGTYFLVVGGGSSPKSSQLTLEYNLELFSELTQTYGHSDAFDTYLFGAGHQKNELDVKEKLSNLSDMDQELLMLYHNESDAITTYRHNHLEGILNGSSYRNNVLSALQSISQNITSQEDKFRFYFTGHGSPETTEEKHYHNNKFHLWEDTEINVQDFINALDQFPKEVPTQILMVQCYAGGFARLIYEGGKSQNGLRPHNQCGFFASLPSETSAGCSPSLKKRKEYSQYFFSAYRKHTEEGETVQADANLDGIITSNEAHAYALVADESIDTPITTSDFLLINHPDIETPKNHEKQPIVNWIQTMDPLRQKVVDGLSKSLNLEITPMLNLKDIKEHGKNFVEIESKALQEVYPNTKDKYEELKKNLMTPIHEQYPNIFHTSPAFENLPFWKRNFFYALLTNHPDYTELSQTKAFLENTLIPDFEKYENQIAYYQRLITLILVEMYKQELLKSKDAALKNKFKQLVACDDQSYF